MLAGEADNLVGVSKRLWERGGMELYCTRKQVQLALTFQGTTFNLNAFPRLEIMENGASHFGAHRIVLLLSNIFETWGCFEERH